jgi:GH15 family glucan-1,4-alpha-glucosidase
MAWVAFDRAIRSVERFGLDGPLDAWRKVRAEIHAEVCSRGYRADLGRFVQAYGGEAVDASLLMIPLVGFLGPDDPRVIRTIDAIEAQLGSDGLIARYQMTDDVDGLPPGEGVFLACTFWLADALVQRGERARAERLFERLLTLRNDLGLLAEEYDPVAHRLLGNFPQGFSHVALVTTAHNLYRPTTAAAERPRG